MNVRANLSLILSLVLVAPVGAQAPAGGMTIEDLRVVVSKSLVIDYPADINRISTSNPEVVDAVPATSREFLLHGKGHGAATVVVWAKNGMRTMYNVTVEHNIDPIRNLLKSAFPNENVQIQSGRDSVALTGIVSSKEVADRMVAAATPLAKSVVNNLAVATPAVSKQIVIRVRFAELNRTAVQQFGVNLVSTGAGNTIGGISTQQFNSTRASTLTGGIPGALAGTTSTFGITDALNVFAFRPDLNLAGFLRALENQGVLQILAEPNLVTTNGREASFLAGGEFPVPVLQGGGNAGAVTIQFREFGIRLNFLPQLTDNSTIKLYVKPEVSTIDLANAVTLSGFTIPALATKRIETNIELGAGQSFVIAGLMDDRVNETFNKLPGLANIPILGALFRSRAVTKSKQELVVIVTPELATPLNSGDKKPEPAWMKEFLPKLNPGDRTGLEMVPGRPERVPGEAAKTPSAPKADASPSPNSSEPKSGKRFLFFGKGGKQTGSKSEATPAAQLVTPKAGEAPAEQQTQPASRAVPTQAVPAQAVPAQADPLPADAPGTAAPVGSPNVSAPGPQGSNSGQRSETQPGPIEKSAAENSPVAAEPAAANPPGTGTPSAAPTQGPTLAPNVPSVKPSGITSLPASLRASSTFGSGPKNNPIPVTRPELRPGDAQ